MRYNMNSGYGRAIFDRFAPIVPTGKNFFVGSSSVINKSIVQEIVGPGDPDGTLRIFSTITLALAACTASAGDVIFLLPGHTETISTNTDLTLSVAGVSLVGLGRGTLRPTLTLDSATSATVNVTKANVSVSNVIFVANFAAIAACFTLTAAKDFAADQCEFRDSAANLNFVTIVDTNTTSNDADGLSITNSKRIGLGADTNTTIVKMDGTNGRLTIRNNYFAHLAVTAAGLMIIATGKVVTDANIENNVCNFLGATNLTTGILITTDGSTNSGILRGNLVQGLDATTEILVTASSGFIFDQNYYSGTADKSGYLLPAADA